MRTMTTLTLRMVKGHFVVSGPDIEPVRFETPGSEGCQTHHPGSRCDGEISAAEKEEPSQP